MGNRHRIQKKERLPNAVQRNHHQTNPDQLKARPFGPEPKTDSESSPENHSPNISTTFNFADVGVVQPKLTIGEPNDKYEQEADRVANEVVQRLNSSQKTEEDDIQRSVQPVGPVMPLQRDGGVVSGTASNEFESQLNQSRSGGSSLDSKLQGKMESAMGADFSGVKVHTDNQSDQLNRSIQAKAFTTGQDIFFKQGEYNPGSRSGQELLAHELTHVVQQTGSGVQRSTIQRKTQNITSLPNNIIGHQMIGKSTTEKIQEAVTEYNQISEDDTGYEKQLEVLSKITQLIGQWNSNHSSGKDQKKDKMQHIENLAVRVSSEHEAVQQQLGSTVDLPDTNGMNVTSKLKTTGKVIGTGVGVGLTSPLLAIGGTVYGVSKGVKEVKKKTTKIPDDLIFDVNQDASIMKKVAKKLYKANDHGSLLSTGQMQKIKELATNTDGLAWLTNAGFKKPEDVKQYGDGQDFSNWENEAPGFKMQVATYQHLMSQLQSDPLGQNDIDYTNTPGYHKAISALGLKEKIYENDLNVWEQTLEQNPQTVEDLSNETKEGLQQNNEDHPKDKRSVLYGKGIGNLGSEQDLVNRNSAAMTIVKRIFMILQKGLTFTNDGENFEEWTQPVATALSHGGRVNIRIPQVGQGKEQHEFFNWLTGGRSTMGKAHMHTRTAGTHRIAIGNNETDDDGNHVTGTGSFKEKGGFHAAIDSGLGTEVGDTYHFGLDLPVGGLGNKDMNGNVILPNGSYGHLYIGYKPPTTQRDGGLLIGCETDAPGMTNSLGHKHTAKATSAEHGPTGGLKDDKIGQKKGGMMVDLAEISKNDKEWMQSLKDLEKNVEDGLVTSRQLVGQRDEELFDN